MSCRPPGWTRPCSRWSTFPYWDWNPGQTVDVWPCTNAASVELFLDGESLGRPRRDPDKGATVSWQVAYRPGTLRAVAL